MHPSSSQSSTPPPAATRSDAEVAEALVSALGGSAEPLNVTSLRGNLEKQLRRPEPKLAEMLEELVRTGRLYRFAPARGKKHRYWHQDPRAYARRAIHDAIAEKPRSLSDLEKSLAARLADLNKSQRQDVLSELVRQQAVYELPKLPGSRNSRYSTQPPDPREYLRTPINRLRKQIEKLAGDLTSYGVPSDRTWAAAIEMLDGRAVGETTTHVELPQPRLPPRVESAADASAEDGPDFASAFDEAFNQIDRRKGSHNFVSLADLRPALGHIARADFDQGLRELRRAGRYELSAAESAGGLRPEQREAGVEESGSLLLYVSRKSP